MLKYFQKNQIKYIDCVGDVMDAYSKMRQEIVTALNDNNLTVDNILRIIDTVSINYDVIARKRDCKSALEILDEYLNCCEYEKMSAGTIENYRLMLSRLLNDLEVYYVKLKGCNKNNIKHQF